MKMSAYDTNCALYNPLLDEITLDLTVPERYGLDLHVPKGYGNSYTDYNNRPFITEDFEEPQDYGQINQAAESYFCHYEEMKRNSSFMHYNQLQQPQHIIQQPQHIIQQQQHIIQQQQHQLSSMLPFDRNRNPTKLGYSNMGTGNSYSNEFNENVASPTISSSCEQEKVSGPLQAGFSGSYNENIVHSTTSQSQSGSLSGEEKSVVVKTDPDCSGEEISFKIESDKQSRCSSVLGVTKLEDALPAELGAVKEEKRLKMKAGDRNLDSSKSSSPVKQVANPAKRPRIICNATDLVEDVADCYSGFQGVSMYPSSLLANASIPSYMPPMQSIISDNKVPYNFAPHAEYQQKMSFDFAGSQVQASYRFGSQQSPIQGPVQNVDKFVPRNTSMHTMNGGCHSTPAGYLNCHIQDTPSTPSRMKQSVVMPKPLEVSDVQYPTSPRKTPLTYQNLDAPPLSNPNIASTPKHNPQHYGRGFNFGTPSRSSACYPSVDPRTPSTAHQVTYQDDPLPANTFSAHQTLQKILFSNSPAILDHPLYRLLRELYLSHTRLDQPEFPVQLLKGVPDNLGKLLNNFCNRNSIATVNRDPSVDQIIMEAVRYVHSAFIDKLKRRLKKQGIQLSRCDDEPTLSLDQLCSFMADLNNLGGNGRPTIPQNHLSQNPAVPLEDNYFSLQQRSSLPQSALSVDTQPAGVAPYPQNTYQQHLVPNVYQQESVLVPPVAHSRDPQMVKNYAPLTPSQRSRIDSATVGVEGCYPMTPHNYSNQYGPPVQQFVPPVANYPQAGYGSDPYPDHPFQYVENSGIVAKNCSYNGQQPMLNHPRFNHFDPHSFDPSSTQPYRLDCNPARHGGIDPRVLMMIEADRRGHSLPSSPRKMMRNNNHHGMMASGTKQGMMAAMGADGSVAVEKAGKNKVLPKEAVNAMTDWLRKHEENPYPNDDEKESLVNQTGLTINQINYWFTNARRRILPKWALLREAEKDDRMRKEKERAKYGSSDSSSPSADNNSDMIGTKREPTLS